MREKYLTKILLTTVAIFALQGIVVAQTELPYSNSFDTQEEFDEFTVIDANDDGTTWKGGGNSYQAYYLYNVTNDANDWLVSPIFKTSCNFTTINITAKRSLASYIEQFEVYLLDSDKSIDSAVKISDIIYPPSASYEGYSFDYEIPTSFGGEFCVAVKCVSEADQDMLYIDYLEVDAFNGATAVVASSGNGLVSLNGSDLSSGETEIVVIGDEVEFVAEASSGYAFVNWTDADGIVVSSNATYSVTVDGDISLTANFQDATIDQTIAIESIEESDVKAVASNGTITIIGAETGAEIAIYGTNGIMLYSGVATSATETISVSATGLVIVKVDNTLIKVIM